MRKKLSIAGKQYTKQDGTQGTEWTDLGVLNVSQNGKEYILLDPKINLAALPVGENGMVMVSVIVDQQNNQQGQPQQNNQQPQQNQIYNPPPAQYENAQGRPQTQQQYNQNQQNHQQR